MKKILALVLIMVLCAGFTACTKNDSGEANNGTTSNGSQLDEGSENATPLSESEIQQMYTDPEKFIDRTVTLRGEVLNTPEADENGIYFQMYYDPENREMNTFIAYPDSDFELDDGDYVMLTGVVKGKVEGTNAFGATLTLPCIVADTLEKSSYAEVMAPSLKTVTLTDASVSQNNYTVSLTKVEFAEQETRLYFTVENAGTATFNLYSFNAKVVQNGKQYEEQTNYDADYPEIQSDLLPGVTTEGIIVFPAMDQANFQVVLDAYSDDYKEDFELYTFDVSVS